jgi:hypothetical protein
MYTTSPRGTSDITSELFLIQEQSGNHVPQADFSLPIAWPDLDYFRFADHPGVIGRASTGNPRHGFE